MSGAMNVDCPEWNKDDLGRCLDHGPITDHAYRPDRQGQWVTGRCDLCGEPKSAHLACTCHVRSDAIGPHTRGCPNHPEATR